MHDFTGDHHGLRWHDLDQADSWNNIALVQGAWKLKTETDGGNGNTQAIITY